MSTVGILALAMGSGDTSIRLLSTVGFPPNGGIVKIGSEYILVGNSTDTQLLNCTRAYVGSSAASHAVGVAVTLIEGSVMIPVAVASGSTPAAPVSRTDSIVNETVSSLTDPTAVPTFDQIDQFTMFSILLDSSGANQTWTLPSPSQAAVGRRVTIVFQAASAKTLTVNTVSISAGTGQSFVWDGTAWYAV